MWHQYRAFAESRPRSPSGACGAAAFAATGALAATLAGAAAGAAAAGLAAAAPPAAAPGALCGGAKRTALQLLLRKDSAEAVASPASSSLSSCCAWPKVPCHSRSGLTGWAGATLRDGAGQGGTVGVHGCVGLCRGGPRGSSWPVPAACEQGVVQCAGGGGQVEAGRWRRAGGGGQVEAGRWRRAGGGGIVPCPAG